MLLTASVGFLADVCVFEPGGFVGSLKPFTDFESCREGELQQGT